MLVGQPGLLKRVNEDIITDLIYECGPVSKPELTVLTKLSLPTVNKIVDSLEKKDIIRQQGLIGSTSGRKAKVYVANENAGNVVALYFWDNTYMAALINMIGERSELLSVPVAAQNRESALESTYMVIDKLIKLSNAPVKAIGIGVPGVVKKNNTISSIPSIPGWEDLNLKELIEKKYEIPTCVENDVKLTTIGYYHNFLEKKYDNIVYLYIGNGIGSGIIINRILYRGYTSFAGEFGHLSSLGQDNNISYVKTGGWLETMMNQKPEQLEELLAIGISNYVATLNPEVMVIQSKKFDGDILKKIVVKMEQYVPRDNFPEFIYCPRNDYGLDGIFKMCMANVSTSKKLIDEQCV